MAAGMSATALSHEQTMENADRAAKDLETLLSEFFQNSHA
jgi:purine nucleoside phosphorylase